MTDDERMAHVAKATGAFNTKQRPSEKEEPKTGVRKKPPPGLRETIPDGAPPAPPEPPKEAPKLESEAAIADAIAQLGGKLTVENVRGLIVAECRELETLLLEKNAGYGNSALDPVRLFSKASPIEQLKVRIDDKLSRISRGDLTKVKEEDLKVVTKDLLGYLILIRVAWRLGLE